MFCVDIKLHVRHGPRSVTVKGAEARVDVKNAKNPAAFLRFLLRKIPRTEGLINLWQNLHVPLTSHPSLNLTLSGLLRELESMRFPPWKLDMDPRDHHDPELEALERTLALDRTEPVERTDRLERLLEADMDEMPARNVGEFSVKGMGANSERL